MFFSLECHPYCGDYLSPDAEKVSEATQNNSLNSTDQIVREAIQNSLDAVSPGNRIVPVDFYLGNLDKNGFFKLLGEKYQLDEEKKEKMPTDFLAIRDCNTYGLTGDIQDKNSNFYKLVFGFLRGKNENDQNSGGSYGIGKTAFLRLGAGFVIYYSRIQTEERLSIFYCSSNFREHLFSKEILPEGIAWWGEKQSADNNRIWPVTDPERVKAILDLFNFPGYSESECGTTIIIPFIDREKELENIRKNYSIDESLSYNVLPWTTSYSQYLLYSVQKWYAPRLCRENFLAEMKRDVNDQARLTSCVYRFYENKWNAVPYCKTTFFEYTKEIQTLYDAALNEQFEDTEDMFKLSIELNSNNENAQHDKKEPFGWVVLKKYVLPDSSGSQLREIFSFLNFNERHKQLLYCRKPGMILTYQDEAWQKCLRDVNLKEDEWLLGIFVVNSTKQVKIRKNGELKEIPAEQMFRKTERGDHYGWPNDAKPYGFNLISNICSNITKELKNREKELVPSEENSLDKVISNFLGTFFNVSDKGNGSSGKDPEGNGSIPVTGSEPKNQKTSYKKTKVEFASPQYSNNGNFSLVKVPFKLIVKAEHPDISIHLAVAKNPGQIIASEWTELFAREKFPMEICDIELPTPHTFENQGSSLKISVQTDKNIKVEGSLTYKLMRKDISCVLLFEVLK